MKDRTAGILFGIGLALGFLPILLASMLVKENLFVVCIDCMDTFWEGRESKSGS